MNFEGLRITIFKNANKRESTHPDCNIMIKNGDDIVAEGGVYIATDRDTGETRRDKNGNTWLTGKLKNPRPRQQNPGDYPPTPGQDSDVPF